MKLDKKQADDWQFLLRVAAHVRCGLRLSGLEQQMQRAHNVVALQDSVSITLPPDLAKALAKVDKLRGRLT